MDHWMLDAESRQRWRTLPRTVVVLAAVGAQFARAPGTGTLVLVMVLALAMGAVFWLPILLIHRRVGTGSSSPYTVTRLYEAPSAQSGGEAPSRSPGPVLGNMVLRENEWKWGPISREGARYGILTWPVAEICAVKYYRRRTYFPRPEQGYLEIDMGDFGRARLMVWDFSYAYRHWAQLPGVKGVGFSLGA
jgi:hypothetical protein